MLRNIEQQAKRKIAIEQVPTVVDVRARQMELTSAAVREVLEADDHGSYCVLVDALATDYELRDIAAAAIKLAHETKASPDNGSDVDISIPVREPRSRDRDRGERSSPAEGWGERMARHERAETMDDSPRRDKKKPRTDRLPKRGNSAKDTNFVRLYIPVGKRANIRPGDLVGAIANEASIDSSAIGSIEITDNFSLVEVPDADADQIIDALNQTKIRGKRVKARRERF